MKKLFLSVVIAGVCGCGGDRKIPDVSHVKMDIQIQRFENDFFALDTNNLSASLQNLYQKYPAFFQDFIFNILALPAHPDSAVAVENGVRSFVSSYYTFKRHG